jgi:hypothetical protein
MSLLFPLASGFPRFYTYKESEGKLIDDIPGAFWNDPWGDESNYEGKCTDDAQKFPIRYPISDPRQYAGGERKIYSEGHIRH